MTEPGPRSLAGVYLLETPKYGRPQAVDFDAVVAAATAIGKHAKAQSHGAVTALRYPQGALWMILATKRLTQVLPEAADSVVSLNDATFRLDDPGRFRRYLLHTQGVRTPLWACMLMVSASMRRTRARELLGIGDDDSPLMDRGAFQVFYRPHEMPPVNG